MRLQYLLIVFVLAWIPAGPLWAQDADPDDLSPHSDAVLISETQWIQPGAPFTLGLHMVMDEGWHSYWINPGDSGEPTEIEWALPDGFTTGPMQWPFPHRIDAPPLRSYGYSDEVVLLTELTPPPDLQPGTSIEITGTAYWLICADICLPAEAPVSMTLPVRSEAPPATEQAALYDKARSALPVSRPDWSVEAASYSGSYVLKITPETDIPLDQAYFYPGDATTLEHAAPQPISLEGDAYLIAMQQSEYATGTAERLQGVLVTDARDEPGENVLAVQIDAPVIQDGSLPVQPASDAASFPLLLIMAFAGGLLLNLMPCVFPVLSLKILGFASQAEQSRQSMRQQGFLFGAGVVVSFWILAGLLLALRAAGSQIGWGFQLQSPLFVAAMAILFFAIGLNLLGVFEVGSGLIRHANTLGSQASHGQRSFFDGVLATLVATPCTAPFMGAALGAAIVLPTWQSVVIFTVLGAGMATPYVVLSMAPGVVERLPRPGPWMETLKQILAFPMLATTIWLIWVFGQQAGTDGIAFLLFGLLLLGLALWIMGRWPGIQLSTRMRIITRSIALVVILAALGTVYMGAVNGPGTASASEGPGDSAWQSFSLDEVNRLREEGRPIFIDFTAAWCLTCQVNKRTTLNTDAVQAAFKQKGVVLFQADWTNRDDEITQALEAHGRSGVPLYVLYPGAETGPLLLPEILTEQILLDALNDLPDQQVASVSLIQ